MRGRLLVVAVGLAAVLAASSWWYRRSRNADVIELPAFIEIPPGPRAPKRAAFGVEVGRTHLEVVTALAASRGLTCVDNSMRAMIAANREAKRREVEAARSSTAADAITGASILKRRSPSERNPQVRYSCEQTPAAALEDRPRPEVAGRWLFVFDSPTHPLRHVSFRRQHRDPVAARADLTGTLRVFNAEFGPPHTVTGTLAVTASGALALDRLDLVKHEWTWPDLHLEVSARNLGRGLDVNESVEIPWPVRSDSPASARAD